MAFYYATRLLPPSRLVHGEFPLKPQSAFGITRDSASAIDKI
jgi:hypothetical protein